MAKTKKSVPKKDNRLKVAVRQLASEKSKAASATRYLSSLCDELEKASAGLLNTSESDFPYKFFSLSRKELFKDTDKFTANEFVNSFGISDELIDQLKLPVDNLVEVRPLDNFFPGIDLIAGFYGLDITDPKVIAESKRFRKLEVLLRKRLNDVNVFRVGQVEIRCYVAGFAKHGSIAGLVTTAIET